MWIIPGVHRRSRDERGVRKEEKKGEEKTGKPCERVIKSTPSVNILYSCLITSAGQKCIFFKTMKFL